MPHYAKIKDGEVVDIFNFRTDIPTDEWAMKGLLPLFYVYPSYEEGTTPERDNGYYIFPDKVEFVSNTYYHIDTLDEVKERKLKELESYMSSFFPELHKQTNAALGVYDEAKSEEIKQRIIKSRNKFKELEASILSLESIKDVEEFVYDYNPED